MDTDAGEAITNAADTIQEESKPLIRLIVGLGNPGDDYAGTRHNAGFRTVDAVIAKAETISKPEWQPELGEFFKARIESREFFMLKPMTFMNSSGFAVGETLGHLTITPDEMLVVCDDLDLDFGRIRMRMKGSTGGHRGLASIGEVLGTSDFPRLRIGIGRPRSMEQSIIDYVLGTWTSDELEAVPEIFGQAAKMAVATISNGVDSVSWRASDNVNAKVQGEQN
ncbi:MAG: aminoacyl-tRNA hydrolase [Victivallales bacterium]|nr:aminoacyl-tRNA hydrolase [Victivallales bacterium]